MKNYDITKYGAIPDGKTVCTKAIQKAVYLCEKVMIDQEKSKSL